MPARRTQLGDCHNFGRRVERREGRVHKPRTIVWERLLLSAKSPLRRLLAREAQREGWGRQAFEFLPSLTFARDADGLGGSVEAVRLAPLRKADAHVLATIVGRSLALWSWLGVSDLHWENLVLGADARGRIVFGPLDIEMILADLALPTETKLLPDADPEYAALCQHAAGVRRVLPYLGKPVRAEHVVAMASAYRATLTLLDRIAPDITRVFEGLRALRTAPIRVCLRSTEEYVRAARDPGSLWPPLLDAEAEQMARGDIPYFFRLYGQRGIHYYTNQALTQHARLPLHGDTPQLDPMLSLARKLRAPSRKRLCDEGLFIVLGAFDHQGLTGRHASETLAINFGKRSLVVELPTGEELSSPRNLRAHVSSVYLPCRCGETRGVLVPRVSVCDAP
jgi:hypothetical protein